MVIGDIVRNLVRRVRALGYLEIGGQRVVVLEHANNHMCEILFQLRSGSKTEAQTDDSEMTLMKGGPTELKSGMRTLIVERLLFPFLRSSVCIMYCVLVCIFIINNDHHERRPNAN